MLLGATVHFQAGKTMHDKLRGVKDEVYEAEFLMVNENV
jgi:hypothetical protein